MMRKGNIKKTECLYTNSTAGVSVYKGILPSNHVVAVKEQTHQSLNDANFAIHEAMNQKSLRHRCICQVHEFWLEELRNNCYKSVIVQELMDGDLFDEIKARKQRNDPWREEELMLYLKDIAEACEYAKTNDVCHRDIKPQNIFTISGCVKLGDFGSSGNTIWSSSQETLHGSPFFLSPELKSEFARKLVNGPGTHLAYNAFQSDVYSLGITFLYLAMLDTPKELMNLDQLEETTEIILGRISQYPRLRTILKEMLKVEPDQRISFAGILEAVDGFFSDPSLRSRPSDALTLSDDSPIVSSKGFKPSECEAQYPVTKSAFSRVETLEFDFEWESSIRSSITVSKPPPPLEDTKEAKPVRSCCVCTEPVYEQAWSAAVPTPLQIFSYVFERLCSAKCLSTLADSVAHYDKTKCLACKREVDMMASQRPLILKCKHCFHSKDCLYRSLEVRTERFRLPLPSDCQQCKFPIETAYLYNFFGGSMELFKKIKQTTGHNVCLSCGREATLKLPCNHFVCTECCPLACRKWICSQCGTTMER